MSRVLKPVDKLDDDAVLAFAVTAVQQMSRSDLDRAIASCERDAARGTSPAMWLAAGDAFRHERRRRYGR
jgi:hypothetical protein